ncbi:MAG: DUF177 domain-containing protein [Roseivirga sp.]|nr:DUF177 domain-containing protein [Roseivirga sp.]
MKAFRQYDIHIFKLAIGLHDYQFEIKDEFFELFDNELVSKGNLTIDVSLTKSETMIEMVLHIQGSVELECDRSLDHFDYPINSHRKMIYRLGEEMEELSDELMVIPKDSQIINIASLLFEFIGLEVPMKKLHPRFQTEEEDDDEEFLEIYSSTTETEEEQNQEEQVDPRWEALKKLKK